MTRTININGKASVVYREANEMPGCIGGPAGPRRWMPAIVLCLEEHKLTVEQGPMIQELVKADNITLHQIVTLSTSPPLRPAMGPPVHQPGAAVCGNDKTYVVRCFARNYTPSEEAWLAPIIAEAKRAVREEETLALLRAQEHRVVKDSIENAAKKDRPCRICWLTHDANFTRIEIRRRKPILLTGVFSEFFALVHAAHKDGKRGLDTKDNKLCLLCAGYKNPKKFFAEHGLRHEFEALFYTRARGFISLLSVRHKGAIKVR